jgi:hypothetical protein
MPIRWTRRMATVIACAAAVGLSTVAPSAAAPEVAPAGQASTNSTAHPTDWPTLRALLKIMIGTAKYHDVNVALAEGYVPGPVNEGVCTTDPTGARGYHYTNWDRLLAPVDLSKPPILVYQPDGRGGKKLVAAEFFQLDADQNTATADDVPFIGRRPFDGPMDGHFPGMPVHYDIIAWVWQFNPAGTFAPFNPWGSCEE